MVTVCKGGLPREASPLCPPGISVFPSTPSEYFTISLHQKFLSPPKTVYVFRNNNSFLGGKSIFSYIPPQILYPFPSIPSTNLPFPSNPWQPPSVKMDNVNIKICQTVWNKKIFIYYWKHIIFLVQILI